MEKAIRKIEDQRQIRYTDEQRSTLDTALNGNITVITGGPGTGKTTVIDAIVRLFEELGLHTVLCAPTGKAAKRMTEVTGAEAYTVHRLLGARIAEDDETVLFDKNEVIFALSAVDGLSIWIISLTFSASILENRQ